MRHFPIHPTLFALQEAKKEAIDKLLRLKLTYKEITGKEFAAPGDRKQKVCLRVTAFSLLVIG